MEQAGGKPTQPSKPDSEAPSQAAAATAVAPQPDNLEPKKEAVDGLGSGTDNPDLNLLVSDSADGSEPKAPSPRSKSPKPGQGSGELIIKTTVPASVNLDITSSYPAGSNPYVSRSLSSSSTSFKEKMDYVRNVLGRWGSNVKEAAKKAEVLAGNTWQHLKTSPSFADAAMGRIAHGTKVLAEGGYEKIFRQTFETAADELLKSSYACYLSTSAGPVMGALYVSTAKLAFCSDSALPYKNGDQTEWSYYKVVIPLHELKAINPSSSKTTPAEKYMQIISIDNHEFWYMGFLNYEGAVTSLQEALQGGTSQSV